MWIKDEISIDPDHAPCGVALIGDDGCLLAVNEPLIRMLDIDRHRLSEMSIDALLAPSARVFMQMVLLPMLRLQGSANEICLVMRTRGGKDIHVLCSGQRRIEAGRGVNQCVFLPVEQRRKVEEQLMQSWRVTEQVPGVLFQLEIDAQGPTRFLHITDHIVPMSGLTPAQLRQDAAALLAMLLPEDAQRVLSLMTTDLPEGRVQVEELRYRRLGDQKTSWCELRFIARPLPDGRRHWNGYLCDITTQKALEEQLRETDKLRVTATLAAGVAHDFNNLLGSITGLAELCLASAQEGTRMHRNLDNILATGRKAAVLVRQMLEYARQMPQSCEPLDLGDLVNRLQPLLQVALPTGVTVSAGIPARAPVLADPVQLEQVLLNLVNNAGYAMRAQGGRIDIDTQMDEGTRNPLGRPAVHLRVRDQGCGIDPEDLPHIFQPFFTTKPVGEGTGLGLSAAYGIVKGHGGHIEVHSQPGLGTCFDIWLPAAAGQPAVPAVGTTQAA